MTTTESYDTLVAPSLLEQKPEIPYAGEVPLVPNVRPVLVLKGSDYDMGYQHAVQLVQIFGSYYLEGAANVPRSEENLAVIRKSEAYIQEHTPWAIDYVKGMTEGCSVLTAKLAPRIAGSLRLA